MNIEVLMSVMHQSNFNIAVKTKIDSDLLIINQCDKDDYQETIMNGHKWRMISTVERGLSKSRNMALKNAQGDICLICDDDEYLSDGYASIIQKAYDELRDASSIVFNLNRINVKMKKTYYRIEKVRIAPWYRGYSSQMLTFKLADIRNLGIVFNEKFGSGTQWGGGEEIIFQNDIRHNRKIIFEYPEVIATIDYSNGSQWFGGYDEKYFYNLGGFIQFQFKRRFLLKELRCLFTCYRLRNEKKLSLSRKMHWMHLGMKGIKTDVTYSQFMERRK